MQFKAIKISLKNGNEAVMQAQLKELFFDYKLDIGKRGDYTPDNIMRMIEMGDEGIDILIKNFESGKTLLTAKSKLAAGEVLTDKLEGEERQIHWGDMWHYAIARMVVAARANGLRPIDGPFGDFKDPDGFKAAAKRAAVLGCEGKWAIHPSQITLANEVMSPSESEILKANRILEAMADAEASGKGAVSLDGRLIDYASIKQAEVLVEKAKQIAGQ